MLIFLEIKLLHQQYELVPQQWTVVAVTSEIITKILVCWGYINKRFVKATKSFSPCLIFDYFRGMCTKV